MAAQSASTASSAPTLSKPRRSLNSSISAAASGASGKAKRPRTKHACDECRRSQKKCDGEKPLCRRCYINGTQCTYTPHKSRSSCACTGPEDVRSDGPIPDVFIFPSSSPTSFYTWSSTDSPDQSPRTSGSEIPSPTYLTLEDKLEATGAAGHGDPHLSHLASQAQSQISSTGFSPRTFVYSHSRRSCSAPNVSTAATLSSSPGPIFIATPAHSSELPHYQLETSTGTPYGSLPSSASGFIDSSPSSTYSDLLTPHGLHIHDGLSSSSLDFGSHGSELRFDNGFDTFFPEGMNSIFSENESSPQNSNDLKLSQGPNATVTASYQLDSGAFHSNMLDLSSVSQLQPALFGTPQSSNQNNNSCQTDSLQFQLGPAFSTQVYQPSQHQQNSSGSVEGLNLQDLDFARSLQSTPDMHARNAEQQQMYSPFTSPSSQGSSGWSPSSLSGFSNASSHSHARSAPGSALPSPSTYQTGFDVYAWAQ